MSGQFCSILSIDLDFAFSPVIATYDDFVEGSRITLDEQRRVREQLNLPSPTVNPDKIAYLRELIAAARSASTPQVHYIEHHHEIVPILDGFTSVRIINVDHHHDVLYPGWHSAEVLDEGNWVLWLARQFRVESYLWVRNPDSEDLDTGVRIDFEYAETEWLDPAQMGPVDKVILCLAHRIGPMPVWLN